MSNPTTMDQAFTSAPQTVLRRTSSSCVRESRSLRAIAVWLLGVVLGASRLTAGEPVARWVADDWAGGSANWVDRVGNQVATAFGQPAKATGQFGGASSGSGIVFDGVDDYFEVSAVNHPVPSKKTVTVVALFKTTQGATGADGSHWRYPGPVNAEAPGEPNDFGLTIGSDGKARAFFNNAIPTAAPVVVTDGLPHTLVLTWSDLDVGNGIARFYVDGVLQGSLASDGGNGVFRDLMRFGRERETTDRWFRGTLGEVRFYESLEDPAELHRSMAGPTQLLANPEIDSGSAVGPGPAAWVSSVGFVPVCGADCAGSDSNPAWDGNGLRFGSNPAAEVTQTISLASPVSLDRLVLEYRIGRVEQQGLYSIGLVFLDSAGAELGSLREPDSGWVAASAQATTETLTLVRSGTPWFNQIASVRVSLRGYQNPYVWSGHYGPGVDFVRLWSYQAVPPKNLEVQRGNTEVTVFWSAQGDGSNLPVVGYRVESSQDGGVTWTFAAHVTPPATSARITSLQNGSSYCFRVAAVTAEGSSAFVTAPLPVTPQPVPGPPTFDAPPVPVVGDRSVTLGWMAPGSVGSSAISDYRVQYSMEDGPWTTFEDGVNTGSTAVVTGLQNGKTYRFRIAAANSLGFGYDSFPTDVVRPIGPLAKIEVSGTEDQVLTFTAAPFTSAFAAANGTGSLLQGIRIRSLPAAGTLRLGAKPVVVGELIPTTGLFDLVYAPAPDESGARSFMLSAFDGVSDSQTSEVVMQLAAVNDGPKVTLSGFRLLYDTTQSSRDANGAIVYRPGFGTGAGDAAAVFAATGQSIPEVRYRMELTVGGTARFAEATFDGWSGLQAKDLRVPDDLAANRFILQRDVSNLKVVSDYPSVTSGSGFTGRLEFWPYNYSQPRNGNLTGGSDSRFDWNDTPGSGNNGHGSFQIHNVSQAQTVFAWNRHHHGGQPEIGFGNNPSADAQPDWTFSTLGSSGWRLQVFAQDSTVPAEFRFTEDTPGNLVFPGSPFADAEGDRLTVLLGVAHGRFTLASDLSVEIGGTPIAPTVSGSPDSLNAYFAKAGNVVFQPEADVSGTQILTLSVSDGTSTTTSTSTLSIAPVNDAPTLTVGIPGNLELMSGIGGIVAPAGIYTVHRFLQTGSFIPDKSGAVEVLLVGGGGGGGSMLGGGGGGGGVVHLPSVPVVAGTAYGISVGEGGAAGVDGSPTMAFGATAAGGGSSGSHDAGDGRDGGSGGGAASNNGRLNQGGKTTGNSLGSNAGTTHGNRGGHMSQTRTGGPTRGAGGGGAGGPGKDTDPNLVGDTGPAGDGSGGSGILNAILGQDLYWGGGGGGGSYVSQTGGHGGRGGGGGGGGNGGGGLGGLDGLDAGGNASGLHGGAGGANTGGGGGGGAWDGGQGGSGGSGIVVVRYLRSALAFLDTGASDTFPPRSGQLAASDRDAGTAFSYGIIGGTGIGSKVIRKGAFGTLEVDSATGSYVYLPDSPAMNALGGDEIRFDVFQVTVSDSVVPEPVTAEIRVEVLGTNDAPTLAAIPSLSGGVEDTEYPISFQTLTTAAKPGDAEPQGVSFRVESVLLGTVLKAGVPVVPGTTTLGPGESLVWRPPADVHGVQQAFTVRAWDGGLASASAVAVSVELAPVNDPPRFPDGSSAAGAAGSASEIKSLTGTTANGVYWILVNGVPTQVYCIMDDAIDGGGWMLAMKGADTGAAFAYGSPHWTTATTLNPTFLRGNSATVNEDAKFAVFNEMPADKVMAVFPTVPASLRGGAVSGQSYGFLWIEDMPTPANTANYPGRPVQGSYAGRTLRELFASEEKIFLRDATSDLPYRAAATGVFSSQSDVRFFGFNYRNANGGNGWNRVRFGFGWNENGGGLYPGGNETSNDISGGIGMDRANWSAGDLIGCCQNSSGLNRQLAFEVYVKGGGLPISMRRNNLTPVLEDLPAAGNLGDPVSSLAGAPLDPDPEAVGGVAVVAVDETNGLWQFSTDGGNLWLGLSGVEEKAARLLRGDVVSHRVRFLPRQDFHGTAFIDVRLWDQTSGIAGAIADVTANGGSSAYSSGIVRWVAFVTPVNDAPTISAIRDQMSEEDGAPEVVTLKVGDPETVATDLTLSMVSSNPGVVAADGIVLEGVGADRTLVLTPVANASGTSTITVTVTDGGGLSATQSFVLTVTAVNDVPTIGAISDQTTLEDMATGAIPFTVDDFETAAGSLTATATSSNVRVVAAGGISLGGSGADRTITLTPVANASGTSTITVTVVDAGGLSATRSFALVVTPVPDVPTGEGFLLGAGLMPVVDAAGRYRLEASLGQVIAGSLPIVSGVELASGFWVFDLLADALVSPMGGVPTPAQAAKGLMLREVTVAGTEAGHRSFNASARMASGVRLPDARMRVASVGEGAKVRIAVSGLPRARWHVQSAEGFGTGSWRHEGILQLDAEGEGVLETSGGDESAVRFYRLVQP